MEARLTFAEKLTAESIVPQIEARYREAIAARAAGLATPEGSCA